MSLRGMVVLAAVASLSASSCSNPDREYLVRPSREEEGSGGVAGEGGSESKAGESSGGAHDEAGSGLGDSCSGVEDCDDGSPCNGFERCIDGLCVAGDPAICGKGQLCYDVDAETTRCFAEKESTWLLFDQQLTGSEQNALYAVNVKSGAYDPVLVSTTLAEEQEVTNTYWSRDGRRAAYLTRKIGTETALQAYVVEISEERPGAPLPLADLPVESLWWSPDNTAILLRDVDSALHLVRIGAEGPEAPLTITEPSHEATTAEWAPDSQSLAYLAGDAFWVDLRESVPAEPTPLGASVGGARFNVTGTWLGFFDAGAGGGVFAASIPPTPSAPAIRVSQGMTLDATNLYWSPTGKYFAYTTPVNSSTAAVYLVDLTGVTPTTEPLVTNLDTSEFNRLHAFACWSPDGTMLSYRKPATSEGVNASWVYRLKRETSESIGSVPKHTGAGPCWSRTGKYLFATIQSDASSEPEFRLYTQGNDSYSSALPIQRGDSGTIYLTYFAPDDSSLVLVREEESGDRELLYVDLRQGLDATTTAPQRLNLTHYSRNTTWSSGGGFVAFNGARDDGTAYDNYLVDVTGEAPSAVKKLTTAGSSDFSCVWQPVR